MNDPENVLTGNEEKTLADLEHYGRLGMKWGKRIFSGNSGSSGGSSSGGGSKSGSDSSGGGSSGGSSGSHRSADSKEAKALAKKSAHELSNAELKKLNERMNLEKQFKQLTATEKSAGQKFVEEVLTNYAKQAAQLALSTYLNPKIIAAVKPKEKEAVVDAAAELVGKLNKIPKP